MTIICLDLLETAATTIHKVHTAENISNHWITAFGCYIVHIKLLYDRAIKHTA